MDTILWHIIFSLLLTYTFSRSQHTALESLGYGTDWISIVPRGAGNCYVLRDPATQAPDAVPTVAVEWATFLLPFREVQGSDLSTETGCSD
jgi:hypothetical protein